VALVLSRPNTNRSEMLDFAAKSIDSCLEKLRFKVPRKDRVRNGSQLGQLHGTSQNVQNRSPTLVAGVSSQDV